MIQTHNLGFPRIGGNRELKFALETYWKGASSLEELQDIAAQLRKRHWRIQKNLDRVPVGDFSLYDQVLDMSMMLGNLPARANNLPGDPLDQYFRLARGRSNPSVDAQIPDFNGIDAGEMTKWFNTNYHYIVPEFSKDTQFRLTDFSLFSHVSEALSEGVRAKPVIIGPLTYLFLGKTVDGSDRLALLPRLLPAYQKLLEQLADRGIDWVQIDEPILATDLDHNWQQAFKQAYDSLHHHTIKLLLTTYFGALQSNLSLAIHLPVQGIHLDAIYGQADIALLLAELPHDRILSLGIIDGRNIWKSDLNALLDWLEPIAKQLGNRLWLAPSCSLLHVPVDLNLETQLDAEIKNWLAFAQQKLEELDILAKALNHGRASVNAALEANQMAIKNRRQSQRVHNPAVKSALAALDQQAGNRQSPYDKRAMIQAAHLDLPLLPTTTIGSFPQTAEIRQARSQFRSGNIDKPTYEKTMRKEIERCVQEQEKIGLDVLVHGEPERNDMVEYFGEQLTGYAFTQFGWVQSYGSRCVKPPVLFGDISRPSPMTVSWITYAQSLTQKPMKGMLTGPVTLLNWSFVRNDQPRAVSCQQLALAIREEVLDLEKAGISIIQIDEAALREGMPLRKSEWPAYLDWAIAAFRTAANGVSDKTQIHTHMCYSEFNDILPAIANMDADVITIESARSAMSLLDAFAEFNYPNEIGPGLYDIHSPNIPSQAQFEKQIQQAVKRIPLERLWVNPDCGLKTRQWPEVISALKNMVSAARHCRTKPQQA